MSYAERITATIADSQTDAFYRIKTSQPETLIDTKQIFDNLPLIYDDSEVSGSGTASNHSANRASSTMSVTATTAGKRVRQTFQRFNYQPGKAQVAVFTFVLHTNGAGVTKEIGAFDDNNGLFFRMDGTTANFVVRSNVTGTPADTAIAQTNWNQDKLDGTGASGVTLDFTKALIFFVDFEWLGVGSIRFGFFVDGKPIYAHRVDNANVITSVYMSTPNLPIRYSIENDGTGGALELEHICSTIYSDGGNQRTGVVRAVDRGVSAFTTLNNTSIYPLVSIRLKSGYLGATIIIQSLSALLDGVNIEFRIGLYLNPTIAGTDAAVWTSAGTGSAIEYDVTRDTTNTITGGTLLYSTYNSDVTAITSDSIDNTLRLGSAIDGTPDEIVLAVQNLTNSTDNYYGSLIFQEIF